MTQQTWNHRALLLLRAALGIVFVAHGWQKLTVFGLTGLSGYLAAAGMPLPTINAAILITVELVGGLALIAGLGTRVASALLAFTMAVAIGLVHIGNGFFAQNNGFEFPFTLMLVLLAMVMTGAGAYSVDARLFGGAAPVRRDEIDFKRAA
ncbi:MAG TPA: DoxX family protein [Vicinamibacterales bacterium]|nr:DoxX family protein [Vicinamibacterales bacterium]